MKLNGEILIINIVESVQETDAQRSTNVFSPSMDIYECIEGLFYEIELPGVTADNINIFQEKGKLVIRGRKKHEAANEKGRFHLLERPFGSFEKILELPADAAPEHIKAALRNGVLKVHVSRSPEAGKKQSRLTISEDMG